MNRDTRREYRRHLQVWKRGVPPQVPVPAPRPSEEAMERLARPVERLASRNDPWDTGQLAAIYPDAGRGWRAPR